MSVRSVTVGGSLRRAWIGYQRRLDDALAADGFTDRALPDGRVLRLCARSLDVTSATIGRELGMTRQGAGKIVAGLQVRGYVRMVASASDGREKAVQLTSRAHAYLRAHRRAARRIERELEEQVGPDAMAGFHQVLDVLGADAGQARLRAYLRKALRAAEEPES